MITHREIKISGEETSIENVNSYLSIAKDSQEIHREPDMLMPGMFYVHLASQYIDKEILRVEAKFSGIRKYPLDGKIDIIENDKHFSFRFYDEIGEIAHILFQLGNGSELNLAKLKKLYSLSGDLIKIGDGITEKKEAIYNGQIASFITNPYWEDPELVPYIGKPLKLNKRERHYPIEWKIENDDRNKELRIGVGKSLISIVDKGFVKKGLKKIYSKANS